MSVPAIGLNETQPPAVTPRRGGRLWGMVSWGSFLGLFSIGIILLLNPWMSRWGATEEETTRALPGDDLVPGADTQATRAITIQAPPSAVWPWLLQLGVDRGGMYSYDWAENLVGLNVHSADVIVPEWQTLQVGDFIRFVPKEHMVRVGPGLYVTTVEPERAMLGCFGMSDAPPAPCVASWQFVLEPLDNGGTRLLVRMRTAAGSASARFMSALFQPIPFLMERRMLLGIRDRAERLAATSEPIPGGSAGLGSRLPADY